jgi:3-oxoacyl-[acyl-carrier protein] reductase
VVLGIRRPQADGVRTGRSALVGGGATGIGRAVAEQLVESGYRVIITGRRADVLHATAREIDAEPLVADVAAPDPPAVVSDVDVLVLNAGGPAPGRILQVTDAQWDQAFALLVTGPLRLARRAVPAMAERGFGRVRADRGVTVNCVAPGATATGRRREILEARAAATGVTFADLEAADAADVPLGRAAQPEEIATAVAFLASAAASFVNGTVLTVDGGRTEAV